jgi:hypothetical protein
VLNRVRWRETRVLKTKPCHPFFIALLGTAGAGGEAVVGGDFQQMGMVVNGVAAALERRAF